MVKTKLKYPKTVTIFGKKFKIVFKDIPGRDDNGEIAFAGQCLRSDGIIIFNSMLSWTKEDFLQTLLHEIFHGVIHRTAIVQTALHPQVEEVIVDNIATCLCENFKISFK